MADIRLDRTDDSGWRICFRLAPRAGEHFKFRRVADGGASAVAFAVGNGFNSKTRATIRPTERFDLAVAFRARDAAAAVGGNSPTTNDRASVISCWSVEVSKSRCQ
jgi:hypothetical protein